MNTRMPDANGRPAPRERGGAGFTLVEVILSLVILGIIGTIGALGFTDAVRGYVYGVDNSNLAGKAQAALDRLTLELTHVDFWDDATGEAQDGISGAKAQELTYAVDFGGGKAAESGIQLAYDSGAKEVKLNGDVLVDDVTDFTLTYYKDTTTAQETSDYQPGVTMCIGISLELTGANNVPVTFTTRVVPMFDLPYAAP